MSTEHLPVVVIGGGQAGLSISHLLGERALDHVVLERDTICHDWVDRRWDSFCLVTPNFQCRLPGRSYEGPEPEGFLPRDEIVAWLREYAAGFAAPVREHTAVDSLDQGFRLVTSGGPIVADQVVIATGGYHVPRTPPLAAALPPDLCQVHSAAYRSPTDLPPGDVLVVGSGQSGVQIAEDLHRAGRQVHLAVGSAPRAARRYRGHDTITWLEWMGHYRRSAAELGNERGHDRANHYMTGRDGGHDIDLRQWAVDGMRLHGRLLGLDGSVLRFGEGLAHDLDRADAVADSIKDAIDAYIAARGLEAPAEDRYHPVWRPPTGGDDLPLDRLGGVVWATGFRRDDSWNRLPAFDGGGHPVHARGVSPVPGLYWLGLPWQHTWGSGRFAGVAADAAHLVEHIARRAGARPMAAVS